MVPCLAQRVDAASSRARVRALVVDAGEEVWAVVVVLTLPEATDLGVARVASVAHAFVAVVALGNAVGVSSAGLSGAWVNYDRLFGHCRSKQKAMKSTFK